MRINLFALLLCAGLGFLSCNNTTKAPASDVPVPKLIVNKGDDPKDNFGLPSDFFSKTWMQSPDENDKFKGKVFRPEGFRTLKPMRYRTTIKFNEDKTCEYLKLMPNDAHEMQSALWAYNKNKQLRVYESGESGREVVYNWVVKRVNSNILILELTE